MSATLAYFHFQLTLSPTNAADHPQLQKEQKATMRFADSEFVETSIPFGDHQEIELFAITDPPEVTEQPAPDVFHKVSGRHVKMKIKEKANPNGNWTRPPPAGKKVHQQGQPGNASFVYGVLTQKTFHDTRLQLLMKTWGSHVNVRFIASDAADRRWENILVWPELRGRKKLSRKTLRLWRELCNIAADFYVIVDDDTFMVSHNVEISIGALSPDDDLYTGYLLSHIRKFPLVGGGGGIILSNYTMRGLCAHAAAFPKDYCGNSLWPAGDTGTMHCLKRLNIKPMHSVGFYPFPLVDMVEQPVNYCMSTWWINPRFIWCPPVPFMQAIHYLGEDRALEYYYLTHVDPPV